MHNFVRNLLTEWRKLDLPFEDKTFVAAVSGGADSVSLLLGLYELRKLKKLSLRFVIAHYNHDLRGEESEKDEQFVKKLAGELGFELALGRGKMAQEGNLEQNARVARYEFLANTAENLRAHAVLTAHTLNDQAETFLINLIRGSGLEGLGGMKPVRLLDTETRRQGDAERKSEFEPSVSSSPLLVRPLLNWAKREDTENFCRLNNIEFRYDTMNEDLAFRRVRVRKVLLPLLEDFNPKIVETLAKTASLLRMDFEELQAIADERADRFLNESTAKEPHVLALSDIKTLQPSARGRVLRKWLKTNRGDLRSLDLKHFEAIERLIFSRKSGKTVELPNKETVEKQDGKLIFKKLKVEKSPLANYNQD